MTGARAWLDPMINLNIKSAPAYLNVHVLAAVW